MMKCASNSFLTQKLEQALERGDQREADRIYMELDKRNGFGDDMYEKESSVDDELWLDNTEDEWN